MEQIIEQNVTPPTVSFTTKIGNTTFLVGIHFSQTSKETFNDKVERLICNELEQEKYF